LVAALLRVAGVTVGLTKVTAAYTAGFMTHVTCRLTAKNRDQPRNPTLGNRVWTTFTFTVVLHTAVRSHSWNSFNSREDPKTPLASQTPAAYLASDIQLIADTGTLAAFLDCV